MPPSKRILSYARPPRREEPADVPDAPARGLWAIFAVTVLTLACFAGVFVIDAWDALDSPAWERVQTALAVAATIGMTLIAVFHLWVLIVSWWRAWAAAGRGGGWRGGHSPRS